MLLSLFLFAVSNLALVKPEKANAVENYLIQMARFGKLGGKVRKWPLMLEISWFSSTLQQLNKCFLSCQISESGLIEILEKVSQQTEKKTTVKVSPTEISLFISSSTTRLSYFFLCCVFFSSTDGGWWTQTTMMMITNFQLEPWNEPRNWKKICFNGTLNSIFDLFVHVSWILGCDAILCVSLETINREGGTRMWSWYDGIRDRG